MCKHIHFIDGSLGMLLFSLPSISVSFQPVVCTVPTENSGSIKMNPTHPDEIFPSLFWPRMRGLNTEKLPVSVACHADSLMTT